MERGKDGEGMANFWFEKGDKRISLDELICYQCAEIKGETKLIMSVHGGIHIMMPIDKSISEEDLLYLCDRLAFIAWGIHGKYGVIGVRISLEDLDKA